MGLQGSPEWPSRGSNVVEDDGVHNTVFIVEDHEMLAEALALGLAGNGLHPRIAELRGAESIVDQARAFRPALVLLDLELAGTNGLDHVADLAAIGARVLLVTGSRDHAAIAAGLALGAIGCVHKTEPFEVLMEAVAKALSDTPLLATTRREELIRLGWKWLADNRAAKERLARLTHREVEVLTALSDGCSAQQIAKELFVSIGTVRSHIRSILVKLGVSTQLAAVASVRNGLPG